ncbi:hypothetical protein KFS96_004014 [Salmonella enterica]|nr:hypothetical protein [Salmonella enterica]
MIKDDAIARIKVPLQISVRTVNELAVFAARTALIAKMGLNDRLELMSLVGHDF